jgi:hypothetical protein
VNEALPEKSQMVASIKLAKVVADAVTPFNVNALEASQAPIVAPVAPKPIPVVVNVTSASAGVHAATPWEQVPRAKLA